MQSPTTLQSYTVTHTHTHAHTKEITDKIYEVALTHAHMHYSRQMYTHIHNIQTEDRSTQNQNTLSHY